MCGEDGKVALVSDNDRGSPPHVRGRLGIVRAFHRSLGITPACAGKTRAPCDSVQPSRDHPRMCGEDVSYRHSPG